MFLSCVPTETCIHGAPTDKLNMATDLLRSGLAATRLDYVGPISGIFAHQAGGALVTPTGEVYAWGAFTNHWLTLGVPSWQLVEATPRKVTSVSNVRSVLGYSTEFLFISKDDSVLVTGRNNAGQYGNGTEAHLDSGYATVNISEVEHLFINRLSFFAIKKDGTLWGWGGNGYAMIDSSGQKKVTIPIQMMPELRFRTGCSSDDNQYRFVTEGGDLVVWGFNRFGMMGTTEAFVTTPRTVSLPRRVISVAGGINHTAMLLDDGTVVSFGSNEHGQLGRLLDANGNMIESSSTPVVASGLSDVVEIAAWRIPPLPSQGTGICMDGAITGCLG
ncbi:MAG: hypothetical protein IPI29_03125 [Ignavibacteria bacterium]|nr:hypothetical protein [Ignavibacteria bacterium]